MIDKALPRLLEPGEAAALTGSVARGNAGPGSDIDVWVLGRRSGRLQRAVSGVPVTLLCQTVEEACRPDNLCYYEVDDVLVLRDEAGAFERVRRAWRRTRARTWSMVREATEEQLRWELERASHGSPLHRVAFTRLAAWRLACLAVFLRRGWRVPRLQTIRTELGPRPWGLLERILALPAAAVCRRAARALPAAIREARRALRLEASLEEAVPTSLALKAATDPLEAGLLVRRTLMLEVLPDVFRPWGVTDLTGLELFDRAPRLRRVFFALEPGGDPAALTAAYQRLERTLSLAGR